ncbi:MAG: hypothetical protein HHAS10_05460 [Candidatus Altimarinota bacterium]
MEKPQLHIPKNTIPLLIEEICKEEGLDYWIEPEYKYFGYVETERGRRFFKNWHINQNPLASIEVCKDKDYSAQALSRFGFLVPEGKVFFSEEVNLKIEKKRTYEDAQIYGLSLGFPLIIKPNNLSQGAGVFKANTKEEFLDALSRMREYSHAYRVERFYSGRDYRIVVYDEKIISAYERIALSVIGNGRDTIGDLIQKKQDEFFKIGRPEVIDMGDIRILKKLSNIGCSFDTVLPDREKISLLDNANLSTGGESKDITPLLHQDFADIAIRATKSLNLELCGVDIITGDATKSLEDNMNEYIILEVNASPGLDNYITSGNTQRNIVKSMYRKMLLLE